MMHSLTTLHEVSTTHHTLAGTIHDNPLSCRYLYSLDCEMDSFAPQSSWVAQKKKQLWCFDIRNTMLCVKSSSPQTNCKGLLLWPTSLTISGQGPDFIHPATWFGCYFLWPRQCQPDFPNASKSAKHHPPPAAMATAPATKTRAPLQSITHVINIIHYTPGQVCTRIRACKETEE